jgi:hypothetical protein
LSRKIPKISGRHSSGFFRSDHSRNQLGDLDALLGRFQMGDVMLDRIGDRLVEGRKLLRCGLGHFPEGRGKLCVLGAVEFQFGVLVREPRASLRLAPEELPFRFPLSRWWTTNFRCGRLRSL